MKWLEFSKTFVIHSSLSAEQAAKLVDDAVAPEQSYFLWHKDALFRPEAFRVVEYQGRVEDNCFRMKKVFIGRNSFLPIIHGKFVPASAGTSVHIQMALRPIVRFFIYIVFVMLVIGLVETVVAVIMTPANLPVGVGVVILMSAFYFLFLKFGAFAFEEDAEEATTWLKKLFGPDTIDHD